MSFCGRGLHERFPGRDVLKSALLNGQTWFARSGTRVAELGSPAGFEKQKKKNSCRDWSSELCCSRKKVVEPMGKTSLVLDMVDVQEHDSGKRWNTFFFFDWLPFICFGEFHLLFVRYRHQQKFGRSACTFSPDIKSPRDSTGNESQSWQLKGRTILPRQDQEKTEESQSFVQSRMFELCILHAWSEPHIHQTTNQLVKALR